MEGNDVARLERRGEDVEDEEPEVPSEDKYVDKEASDFVQDPHVACSHSVYEFWMSGNVLKLKWRG